MGALGANEENSYENNNIIDCPPLDIKIDERGLGYVLFRCMKHNKNRIAQYIYETEEHDTYGQLLLRCVRTALRLLSKGLTRDDVIVTCTNNHKNSCVPILAALFNGIKVANLDPSLPLADTVYLLNLVKPKLLFVSSNATDLIQQALVELDLDSEIIVFAETDTYTPFSYFLEAHEDEVEYEPSSVSSLKDTVMIFFSSGTTGLAKGICQTHLSLLSQAYTLMYYGFIVGDVDNYLPDCAFRANGTISSVTLLYSSYYWVSASLFMISVILNGCSRIITTYEPKEIWNIIDKYRVSFAFLGPSQCTDLLKIERPEGIDTTSLLYLLTGGSSLALHYMNQLRDVLPGTFVAQAYGQTETSGLITCFSPNDVKDTRLLHYKPTSCGKPVHGVAYKVVDIDTGKIVGVNQEGELLIKSKFVMAGYYKQDSSVAFDSDGWLKTGDIVYYDEDHCFYVVDRIKEMLKYRGWFIAPARLEQVLLQHPAVSTGIVIGIPHPEDVDHPMALVVKNKSHQDTTAEEIENFVNDQVGETQKLRAGVKFIDKIPYTPSGKIRRADLKKMVLSGMI